MFIIFHSHPRVFNSKLKSLNNSLTNKEHVSFYIHENNQMKLESDYKQMHKEKISLESLIKARKIYRIVTDTQRNLNCLYSKQDFS